VRDPSSFPLVFNRKYQDGEGEREGTRVFYSNEQMSKFWVKRMKLGLYQHAVSPIESLTATTDCRKWLFTDGHRPGELSEENSLLSSQKWQMKPIGSLTSTKGLFNATLVGTRLENNVLQPRCGSAEMCCFTYPF
jgi:hypothetical protein